MKWWKKFVKSTKDFWSKKGRIDVSKPFPRLRINDLKYGDYLVYYYGMWLTEKHGESWRSAKYGYVKPCPYHANDYYDKTLLRNKTVLLDTEVRATWSCLETEYMTKKNTRIDVIRPKNITKEQQNIIMDYIEEVGGQEPWYGLRRYAGFLKQMPFYASWASKLLDPKDKELVCSNRVAQARVRAQIKVSKLSYKDTAPADLLIYAVQHPEEFEIYTLKDKGELL